jgi:filamentous hemagglutinin
VSVSVGAGGGIPGQGLSAGLSGAGMGKDSGSTSSTTTAGISGIAGDTGKRTGDNAQGIGKIFDADKVRQEIQAQTKITQEFSKQASTAIASYSTTQKQSLQDQIKKASDADKPALKQQLDQVLLEEKVLNILVGAVTGFGQTMVTKESLATAAEQMREAMIADSKTFKGVVDKNGNSLFNNQSGDSAGINGDGFKLAGTRADLNKLCGVDGGRCDIPRLSNGDIDPDKPVIFKGDYEAFLKTEDGQKMVSAPFGGLQGGDRTWLFGASYEKGGVVDKLLESFAGPHDAIGGSASGLYNKQGNATENQSKLGAVAYETWSGVALVPSAPFAAAQGLPPEVWKAISILLGAAQ